MGDISKKIYNISMGVLVFSLLMLLFKFGMAPFNLSIAWTEVGFGETLVLVHHNATAKVGDRVAGNAGLYGKVDLVTVNGIVRHDGALQYNVEGGEATTVFANEYNKTSVLAIPFLGVWVRVLGHPVGLMALIGAPLAMFVIAMMLSLSRRILPAVRVLEGQMEHHEYKNKREPAETKVRDRSALETATDNSQYHEHVTVLKPFRNRYSM